MLLPLFSVVLLNEISYQMVIPLMTGIIHLTSPAASSLLTHTLYGIGIAAFSAAVMLGSPLLGLVSDKFGRKPVLIASILGMLLSAGLFVVSLYAHNIIFFIIARILSGLSGASTAIVQAAIADMSAARDRAKHFSTIGFALTLGLILGPVLGGYFIDHHFIGSENISVVILPFIVIGLISFLNLFLLIFFYQEKNQEKNFNKNINKNFKAWPVLNLLIIFFLLECSWSLYYLSLPLWLEKNFSFTPGQISVFLSSAGVSMCAGLLFYRLVNHYLSQRHIIKFFFIIFMFNLFGLIIMPGLLFNWISMIMITVSVAVSYIAIMALISIAVKENQGAVMGITLTLMALAWTLTGFLTPFFNWLSDNIAFCDSYY